MTIKPSAAIRNNSIQAWKEDRERERVEKVLLQIEAEERAGIYSYTPLEEVFAEVDRIIEAVEAKAKKSVPSPAGTTFY